MRSVLFDSAIGPVVVALGVGCLTLLAALAVLARPRGAWLRSRLEPYEAATGGVGAEPEVASALPDVHGIYGATERALARAGALPRLERLIERAHVGLKPAQLFLWSLSAGIGVAVVVSFVTSSALLRLAALAVGAIAPTWWVAARGRKRMRTFDDQLPDVLMTMASSLKVGQSFDHSMQAIVDEGLAPASEEFGRVLTETRLGRPLDEALEAMAQRIDSDELRFVVMSVTIQREVGGSLADLFETVAETVRARHHFRRKVRALTAMGRASAYLLVALPLATAAFIGVARPTYLAPLVQDPAGQMMLAAVVAMTIVGALVLKRIVSIKG